MYRSTTTPVGWLLSVVLALCLCSCTAVDTPTDVSQKQTVQDEGVYTLHPRDPRLPKWASKPRRSLRALPGTIEQTQFSPLQYLGYGYRIGEGIIGLPNNLTFPIFDKDAILKDPKFSNYVDLIRLRHASSRTYTSTDMNVSMQEELETKTIRSGLRLNFGLFSIGAKTSYTRTFHSLLLSSKNLAKGRLDLFWNEASVRLAGSDLVLKKASYTHLTEHFIDLLYNSTMDDVLQTYGPFVVVGYYTGGRASSSYLFEEGSTTKKDSWSERVRKYVGATVKWFSDNESASDSTGKKGGGSLNPHLYIGYRASDGKDYSEEYGFSSVYQQTSVYGGARELTYTTPAQKAGVSFFDLGPWFRSLADEKNHTLINITEGGLIGLDKVVHEQNFKRKMERVLAGREESKELAIPYVVICYENKKVLLPDGESEARAAFYPSKSEVPERPRPPYPPKSPSPRFDVREQIPVAILHTRHGDDICILDENLQSRIDRIASISNDKLDEVGIKELDNLCSKMFNCEIKVSRNPSLYSPYGKPEVPGPIPYHQRSGFLKVNFCLGSSSNVFKYKNPHTGIWYVYDKKLRSALSFCDGSDIPEIYGISDWIEGIPEKEINMNTLISYYRIIGL